MTVVASPVGDAVSAALTTLNVRSSVFCLSDLRAPWGLRVDRTDVPKFHLVLDGSACLALDDREPISLCAGDLVVLPRGHAHTISDRPGSAVVALDRIVQDQEPGQVSRIRHGGPGRLTRLLCGGFSIAGTLRDASLALVPDVVRVDGASVAAARWLEPMLAMLGAEADDGQLGSSAVLAKIADVFLTQALRAWLLGAERLGFLVTGQIRDRPIAEALHAIRSRPGEPWTLDLLASEVGLARTALATRFRQLVGEPPMRHLTSVRLRQAAWYLSTTQLTMHEVARLVAYDDPAALSKAFKREFGRAPGAYRRAAQRGPDIRVS
jgi:AraC-like DNA-binding protein